MIRLLPALGAALLAGCGCSPTPAASPAQGTSPSAAPSPAVAAARPFDADRAFASLKKQVAFGPRVPGTKGHDACRDWLLSELKAIPGVKAQRQDYSMTLDGKNLPMSNIVAQINPSAKNQILYCAHWDTRPTADQEIDDDKKKLPIPGANDGASGVAVLLEVARQLAKSPPNVGVQIVLFDGEDYGPGLDRMFLGARYYAKHPALAKPQFAVLLDMIGDRDLGIPREPNSQRMAPGVVRKVFDAAKSLGVKQFTDIPGPEIEDDHLPLQAAGWDAIDLIDFDYGPWHTLDDTVDKCSPESLRAVGIVLEKVAYDEPAEKPDAGHVIR